MPRDHLMTPPAEARAATERTAVRRALAQLPTFGALPPAIRTLLLRRTVMHGVAPGTVLFEQGEIPNFQYVVASGSVHLLGRSQAGRDVLIEVVEPPDLVIPAAVMTGSPFLMRAMVPEPSRLLMIQADTFRDMVAREPALARALTASLAGQFRRLVRQIKSLKLRTTTERVGCHLLALSMRQGTPQSAVLPYEKNLIASQLGMTRESFSRALSALRSAGVTVSGDQVTLRDPKALAITCGFDPLIDGTDEPVQSVGPPAPKPAKARRPHRKAAARPSRR